MQLIKRPCYLTIFKRICSTSLSCPRPLLALPRRHHQNTPLPSQSPSFSGCAHRLYPLNFKEITLGCCNTARSRRNCFHSSVKNTIIWRRMGASQSTDLPDTTGIDRKNKVKLTDEEWKAKLTPEQYSVCRNHGTERAWTGKLLENKGKGIYQCACCGADLFNSSTKFDSGSGWPSFYDTLKDKDEGGGLPAVDTHTDTTHGMVRTEVLCGKCDSHLGHVFNDGPQPTGLRYCINSVSLKFKKDDKGKDEL